MPTTVWNVEPTQSQTAPVSSRTRADAVLAVASGAWAAEDGLIYDIDGINYLGQTGATAIADLPGLVPFGPTTLQHFGWEAGDDAGVPGTLALRYAMGANDAAGPIYGALYLPAANGGYECHTPIQVGTFQSSTEVHVKIYGDGPATVLESHNASGCILITSNSRAHAIEVSDLWLSPEIEGAGSAVSLVGNEGGTQGHATVVVKDITLTPIDLSTTNFWNEPLVATGWNRIEIRDVIHFQGTNAAPSPKPHAICNIDGCYKPQVVGNYFNGTAEFGITNTRTDTVEGGYFVGNTVNGADVGISRIQPGRGPELWIVDNHINSVNKCIDVANGKYMQIRGNLLYGRSDSADDLIYINILDCNDFEISDNVYRTLKVGGNPSSRHVVLETCRAFRISEIGLAGNTTVAPYLIKADCSDGFYLLPNSVQATDSASYPATLIEIESGATNIVDIVGWQDLGLFMPVIADCDAPLELPVSFERYQTANGSVNGPTSVTVGHVTTTRRSAGTGYAQTMVVEQPSAMRGWTYTRGKQSGAWSAWQFQQYAASGTTANRPANAMAGFAYLDTTLGKPVWYNGAAWIDATGATV